MLIYVVLLSLALLLVIADFLSRKRKRRIRNISLIKRIERISQSKYVKWMNDKPETKRYKKLDIMIKQAGFDIRPEAVQFISYILPLFAFMFIIAIRYTNMVNAMMNIEQLRAVAKKIGDSSIADINTEINWGLILAVAFSFHFVPKGFLKLIGGFKAQKAQKEVVMLQTYAIMMLKTKKSVKEILITLMDRSSVLKHPLERAVNNYSNNPKKTLKNLREEVANNDFQKIVISLEQTLKSDRELSLRYLENHRTLGKELNRINRRSKNAKKSVAGILMMIIPLLALLIVGGYPWFVFSMKAIDNVPI